MISISYSYTLYVGLTYTNNNEKHAEHKGNDEKRGQSGGPTRRERGRRIVKGGGQVKCIDKHTYEVRSQTWTGRSYEVIHTEYGWLCSCPDSMEANQICKHA